MIYNAHRYDKILIRAKNTKLIIFVSQKNKINLSAYSIAVIISLSIDEGWWQRPKMVLSSTNILMPW